MTQPKMIEVIRILAKIIFVILLPVCIYAQTPFEIKVEPVGAYGLGQSMGIPVYKMAGTEDMYSFDFLIGLNTYAATPIAVLPGELFLETGDYQWEYFHYQFDSLEDCGAFCPRGLIRVTGIAELEGGSHTALSYSIADSTVLFEINLITTGNPYYGYEYVPLKFYWSECGDNVISFGDPESRSTAVSDGVFEYSGDYTDISDFEGELPTYNGAPSTCIDPQAPDPAQRFIDFYSGGFEILGWQDPLTGDINLNGVPMETADIVLFVNYFMAGLAVFEINIEAQIAATDINLDGIVLSVADLIYMIRIVEGSTIQYQAADFDFNKFIDSLHSVYSNDTEN